MVRWLLTLAVCAAVGALSLHAQVQPVSASYSGVSVEPNEQIFDTMCALDAAGFGADESTLGEMPGRLALRGDLLQLKGPATNALRQFYREHERMDLMEQSGELQSLESWLKEIQEKRPLSQREKLEKALSDALTADLKAAVTEFKQTYR